MAKLKYCALSAPAKTPSRAAPRSEVLRVVRAREDAVARRAAQHVGVVVRLLRPEFSAGQHRRARRRLRDERGHVGVLLVHAVLLRGALGGVEPHERTRERNALLEGGEAFADVRGGVPRRRVLRGVAHLANRVDLREVERAEGVEGDALPAGRRERGRVARVLEAVLAVRGEEGVYAHEREEQQPQQHERQHEHDLPALSRAVRHCR